MHGRWWLYAVFYLPFWVFCVAMMAQDSIGPAVVLGILMSVPLLGALAFTRRFPRYFEISDGSLTIGFPFRTVAIPASEITEVRVVPPEAMEGLLLGIREQDLTTLLGASSAQQLSSMLTSVDIAGMSERLNLSKDMVTAGMGMIIPRFLEFIGNNENLFDLVATFGKGGAGKLGGITRGILH